MSNLLKSFAISNLVKILALSYLSMNLTSIMCLPGASQMGNS